MLPLDHLGRRIAIIGPSNVGKSTLAVKIGKALEIEPVHMDRLYHLPSTHWQRRPQDEFMALHDEIIARDE